MRITHKQAIQVFRRIRDFLGQNSPPVSYGSVEKLVDQLKVVIDRLETFAREQSARASLAQAGTRIKRALAVAIRREFLRPIARAARALFPADTALLQTFPIPKVRDYEGTIAAAEAMAQNASAHKQRFVDAGFPDDFVERLQQAADDLREGMDARAEEFGKRSASTAGLRAEYARGRELVRVLDAMVAPRLVSAPERLAEWRTISRFARFPVPADESETPAPPGNGTTPPGNGTTPPVGGGTTPPVNGQTPTSAPVTNGGERVRSSTEDAEIEA
jgi:hypothetical protein